MERCRCSKVLVTMQLITQCCSTSVQLSTLDRTIHTYYNKKYKEASVHKRYYEFTISTTQSTRKYHSSENDTGTTTISLLVESSNRFKTNKKMTAQGQAQALTMLDT